MLTQQPNTKPLWPHPKHLPHGAASQTGPKDGRWLSLCKSTKLCVGVCGYDGEGGVDERKGRRAANRL